MTYREAIGSGFNVINRNWQLVLLQVITMIINCVCIVLFLVIPVVVAAAAVGIDVDGLSELESVPESLEVYVSKYIGIILIAVFFLVLYLLIISVIAIYVYGASSGTIAFSIKHPEEKFSFKRFFQEGRRLFFPMMWFLTTIGIIFIGVLFVVMVFAALAVVLMQYREQVDSLFWNFLGIFVTLLGISVALLLLTFTLAVTFFGTAILVFRGKGALLSIKEAFSYLHGKPSAYWLYCILLGGSVLAAGILTVMGFSFKDFPTAAILLSVPYQFLTYVIQSYINLLVMAIVFTYYYAGPGVLMSIRENGISSGRGHGHGQPPTE